MKKKIDLKINFDFYEKKSVILSNYDLIQLLKKNYLIKIEIEDEKYNFLNFGGDFGSYFDGNINIFNFKEN
jgi:hypothetical protein